MVQQNESVDAYVVMGNPVAHSQSPFIHGEFARELGHDIAYTRRHVEPGRFREALATFRAEGGRGANVTVPFKEEAFEVCARRSERAEQARRRQYPGVRGGSALG